MPDYDSTSYVASYDPSDEFALLLRDQARRRGVGAAGHVFFLSEGALWAEATAERCFHGCASILDFYHASQRLHELAEALDRSQPGQRTARWKAMLLHDEVDAVIDEGRSFQRQTPEAPETVEENLGFLELHRHRMRYGAYRQNGWFIGSGGVEAGCKTLVGKRLK